MNVAVGRDLWLSGLWALLLVVSGNVAFMLLWTYRRTGDSVALCFGLMAMMLGVAFGMSFWIRATGMPASHQHVLVLLQRSAYVMVVLFMWCGADSVIRAHNGQVTRIRRVTRFWRKRV